MNKTRLHWSKDLNCCKDKKDSMLIFTILGGIFGTLFLLFYTFNFIYTKRIESNYYLTAICKYLYYCYLWYLNLSLIL